MRYNVDVYFREMYLTTIYDIPGDSEANAIELVEESLELDFVAEEQ